MVVLLLLDIFSIQYLARVCSEDLIQDGQGLTYFLNMSVSTPYACNGLRSSAIFGFRLLIA